MCLLVLAFHSLPDQPIAVAANRDECYERPSEPPRLIHQTPGIVAGRDLRAGGTWLGLNEFGVIVGLTNRHAGNGDSGTAPSRGLLCLDALKAPSAREAALTAAARGGSCNPFSMMTVDLDEAWFVSNVDAERPVKLHPGWYFLANGPLEDPASPRIRRANALLERNTFRVTSGFPSPLAALCRDHGKKGRGDASDALCRHGKSSGTRSSTIILGLFAKRFRYWHAEGPPCETEYGEVAIPWQSSSEAPAA
ncbi:MAG: hypothetical protein GXP31_00020 [Kiritimatiellaeota bacterium]|nr:hypothetical protein [Kiritimatiellota bacterium]